MSSLNYGTTLQNGKYTIVKTLGQGGFGITYLATMRTTVNGQFGNMDVDANVTIKEFFISMMSHRSLDGRTLDPNESTLVKDYKRKFIREAMSLSRLQHPNIVKVLEVFEENNTAYYVMEYLDGGTVDDLIRQNGHLTTFQTVSLTLQACSALEYMHDNRLLHLDLKPKNIMLTRDGQLKLIDFGLSKQYKENGEPEESTSIGLGTPGYAPVEQSTYQQDGTLPVTLDIYALGATMYKMLTGQIPPESSIVLNEGLPMQPLRDTGVPGSLIATISKAMAPLKRNRFQSVWELDNVLRGIATPDKTIIDKTIIDDGGNNDGNYGDGGNNDGGGAIIIATPPPPMKKPKKKIKIIIWSVVGVLLLAGAITGVLLLGKGKTSKFIDDYDDEEDTEMVDTDSEKTYVSTDDPVYSDELVEFAENGNADAQFDLGLCYKNGFGVAEDMNEAVRWFRKAAGQEHAYAQNELGVCYYLGEGVAKDFEKALEWFRKAAEQDNEIAEYNLGYCYDNGTGVDLDYTEAVRWYEKSAAQGYALAQCNLGKCYYIGNGVSEDNEKAFQLFTQAAKQGLAEAQFYLGRCYYYGFGTVEDTSKAKEWLQKAADQGYEDAKNYLEDMINDEENEDDDDDNDYDDDDDYDYDAK